MKIALFDLDHTLLDGDTNVLWIAHLVAHGLVDSDTISRQQHFMELYAREQLDMAAYMDFHIGVLASRRMSEWQPILQGFVQTELLPRVAPDALAALRAHQEAGDKVAIVTATNSVIVGVLGQALNVHVIASEVEVADDQVTGRTVGLPSFREHKIARVEAWLGMPLQSESIQSSHFYSDSANDIPLLQAVYFPVVVNPDPKLRAVAEQHGWPQRSWKAQVSERFNTGEHSASPVVSDSQYPLEV